MFLGYVPKDIHWDGEESKLLVCEAIKTSADKSSGDNKKSFTKRMSNLKREPEVCTFLIFHYLIFFFTHNH